MGTLVAEEGAHDELMAPDMAHMALVRGQEGAGNTALE
jgi:hypothetical protein